MLESTVVRYRSLSPPPLLSHHPPTFRHPSPRSLTNQLRLARAWQHLQGRNRADHVLGPLRPSRWRSSFICDGCERFWHAIQRYFPSHAPSKHPILPLSLLIILPSMLPQMPPPIRRKSSSSSIKARCLVSRTCRTTHGSDNRVRRMQLETKSITRAF